VDFKPLMKNSSIFRKNTFKAQMKIKD